VAQEIERKFRVRDDGWRAGAQSSRALRQGYLCLDPERSVRVRLAGARGTLTLKGASRGATRLEYEYEIPAAEAREILERLCLRPLIEKTRHLVPCAGRTWEVDEFGGENAGLVLAELELASEDEEPELPEWVGEEVTGDPRFYNVSLVSRPFSSWGKPPR
jgi:adenylate cyclase